MPTRTSNIFHETEQNKITMKITRAPTLHSLSTEVQTLLQTSSLISSELATLLRATQQIFSAHNELKSRIKSVSEGLQDVVKVEEGVVSGDKDAFESGDVGFGKTPPTTPPTLALGDPAPKIWKPKGREEDDKDAAFAKKSLKRSSQQSSHSNSPSHQTAHINSSNIDTNGYPKQQQQQQQQQPSPSIPGAYVFSETASPVIGEQQGLQPFGALGHGGEEPIDINAVLAQLAIREREDAEAASRKKPEEASHSRASSKRSTPAYRASPPGMTAEKILEEQQRVHVWKPSPPMNGKNAEDNNYAFFLDPDVEDIEYVDSPRASPPTETENVHKTSYAYTNGHTNGVKPAAKTPPQVPNTTSTDTFKNGRTNGAYSYTFPNNNNSSNGTTTNDHQATIRGTTNTTNNNTNNGVPSRPPNPFSRPTTTKANGNSSVPVSLHAPVPATITPAARATRVPLRSSTPTVSRSTNGNGAGNANGNANVKSKGGQQGQQHTRSHTQTNAEMAATIVRSASAMSNASVSSAGAGAGVMSPPYAVFHPPPPVRKSGSGSDSGSDSDSDSESQKFLEKLLERASDTEGIERNKDKEKEKDKGKGKGKEKEKEKERVVEEERGGASTPTLHALKSKGGDDDGIRLQQTQAGESSGSPAASSSKPNSKPPSIKSNSSPKTPGQGLDSSNTAQEEENTRESDSADQVPEATTQENTPMPNTSSKLYSSPPPNHSTVSTFSHDMMRSPQAGQRTPEPGETPRIGNANVNGNANGASSGGNLSLGAAGEAMQSMHVNVNGAANKNGVQAIPSSAFGNVSGGSSVKNSNTGPTGVSSSTSARNSTVSMTSFHPPSPSASSSSGAGSGGESGSAPASSNVSPDSSPGVPPAYVNMNGQQGQGQGQTNSRSSHGHNGGRSSASSSVSTTSEMFARATITRQSHPTNLSYSNGMNHHSGHNGHNREAAGGLFGHDSGRAPGSATPPPLSSSLTRHTSLRREREREREKDRERERERESQRPIPSPVRASSGRRSTVKMASVKTTSATNNGNGDSGEHGVRSHGHGHGHGRGHSRTMSDTTAITPTQADFSSFHFNHFPGSSSSQSGGNTSNVMASVSALPTFQPAVTIGLNPGKSSTTKLERWIPSLTTAAAEERDKKRERERESATNGSNGNGGNRNSSGNGGGSSKEVRRSVHEASSPSIAITSGSSSSSSASVSAQAQAQAQAQPSASTSNGNANTTAPSNGVSKPTFEW